MHVFWFHPRFSSCFSFLPQDSHSEQAVQEALDHFLSLPNKRQPADDDDTRHLQYPDSHRTKPTVVIVAHRLRTVRNADTIVVLDHRGRIVEQGPHDELIVHSNGLYHEMVERAGTTGILPEK
jgi:ABC-type multidrug transport system fused ATPase/permease subunit